MGKVGESRSSSINSFVLKPRYVKGDWCRISRPKLKRFGPLYNFGEGWRNVWVNFRSSPTIKPLVHFWRDVWKIGAWVSKRVSVSPSDCHWTTLNKSNQSYSFHGTTTHTKHKTHKPYYILVIKILFVSGSLADSCLQKNNAACMQALNVSSFQLGFICCSLLPGSVWTQLMQGAST